MQFTWQCYVLTHASTRVSAFPLAAPAVLAHAASEARALEDLQLALDDRVARAHPGLVAALNAPAPPGLEHHWLELDDALPVWSPEGRALEPLRVAVLVRPAQRPYLEVFAPRLDARFWLAGDAPWRERAAPLLRAHLARLPDAQVLALLPAASEGLAACAIEAKPAPLASLRYADLRRAERALPAAGKATAEAQPASDLEADYDEEVTGVRRRRGRSRDDRPRGAVATPTLRALGVPLHGLARRGRLARAYERDELVERLRARLEGERPEALVLVGPAGAGKTAALHELVTRAVSVSASASAGAQAADAEGPASAAPRPHYALDASRLIAGEGGFGDWQQQLLDALAEARAARAVLHLGHVLELLDAGKSAHSDANVAQLLGPALAAREVCAVGEATDEEWARLERRNGAFARAFAVVRVDEPSPEQAARVLARVAEAYGAAGLAVSAGAVAQVLGLVRRFKPYGALVGNAVTMLRRVCEARRHEGAQRVTELDALRHFAGESGVPELLLRDDVPLDLGAVRAFLRARVLGQEEAVERVTEVVAVLKAALPDLRKPVGVLFFAGPTGVGKTELAKGLAEFLFGSRERMVRLDMGEYAGPDALVRLIGTFDAPGHLAAAVRRQPFCVVLLDEVEKAHPAVFDALLGVLGEGRLTDADGRFTDFRNAVLVMTSNLGADTLRARVGFGADAPDAGALRAHYVGEAERFFRPELFNRIDDFVVFSPLPDAVVRRIAAREVDRLREREGLRRADVLLQVSDAAVELLAARGFDPRYGARPLKRALERELVAPVARHLSQRSSNEPLRIAIDRGADDALALRAESLPRGGEGALRATAQALLDRAAELRAQVQRWSRAPLCRALRERVAYIDKASRAPGFFADRREADAALRATAQARSLLERLELLERQAEAAEDLALEAWFARAPSSDLAALDDELAQGGRALRPLRFALYATMFPPTHGAVLYLQAPRAAAWCVELLLRSYERYARSLGLEAKRYHASLERQADAYPHAVRELPTHCVWRSAAAHPVDTATYGVPFAWALSLSGDEACVYASEKGAHRFYESGTSHLVHVEFEPAPAPSEAALEAPPKLAERPHGAEIRRIQRTKKLVHDHRFDTDFDLLEEEDASTPLVPLEPLTERWLARRVLETEAEPWS